MRRAARAGPAERVAFVSLGTIEADIPTVEVPEGRTLAVLVLSGAVAIDERGEPVPRRAALVA